MTYQKLFKILDNEKTIDGASKIDECIIQFGKIETIKAIDYISYFMTTSTFKNMKYWRSCKDDNYYQAIQFLANYLSFKLSSKCFKYLAATA